MNRDMHTADLSQPKAPEALFDPDYMRMVNEAVKMPGMTKEYSGWDVHNNEARKVDAELVKDWTASLNFLLLFAATFAAVLTAFIIESKKLLEPDQGTILVDVMMSFMDNVANGTHRPYTRPEFDAPPFAVTVNILFFASLSASLLAALASVVALQWVADYDAAITRGGSSPGDRAKRRQFRYAGVIWWRMGEIIAALSLLIYCSVILFFVGLTLWMWSIHQTVGLVVAGSAGAGILFYGVSTLIGVAFVSAPFRTPLSRWIYSLCRLPSCSLYWAARLLRLSTTPWLERQRELHQDCDKRVDREVERKKVLAKDALIWLANQLMVSQDSYQRFVLLMSALSKLAQGNRPSFTQKEASWDKILDLIGGTLLNKTLAESLTADARQDRVVMEEAYRALVEVQNLVSPGTEHHYVTDIDGGGYWTQYCGLSEGNSTGGANSGIPNRLFLLLRDVPHHSGLSHEETEATILFSVAQLKNQRNETLERYFRSGGIVFALLPQLLCGECRYIRTATGLGAVE